MEFWTEPQMASIHKMLNPRSIAPRSWARRRGCSMAGGCLAARRSKLKTGCAGLCREPAIRRNHGGEVLQDSVTDLPEAPDVVGVVVRYDQVLDILQ